MKVGATSATALKEKSESLSIPFADLLRGYLMEEALRRIYESVYQEVFWLINDDIIGLERYADNQEERLEFYYIEREKIYSQEKYPAGQPLTYDMAEYLLQELFLSHEEHDVVWEGELEEKADIFQWKLTGTFCDMQVPLVMRIMRIPEKNLRPEIREFPLFMEKKQKPLKIYTYALENRLSEYFFEIMKKLELIADMEAYAVVNHILKTRSVSGRHVMEEISLRIEKEPRVLRLQRMEQIEGYREYAYMRKRWEQYQKKHGETKEAWSEVVERFVCFAKPIWTALYQKEIFFDDWMPELGRFI